MPDIPQQGIPSFPTGGIPSYPDQLDIALDQADILLIVLDTSGRIVSCNHACERWMGLSQQELGTGSSPSAQRVAEELQPLLEWCRRGEYSAGLESKFTAMDSPRCVEWHLTPMRDETGTLRFVVATGKDVTAVKKITEQLTEWLGRYHAIFDNVVEGIITINERGIIESFNKAAERIFGYAAEEMIGHNVRELMPDPYRREHDRYVQNYLSTGQKKIIGIGREAVGVRKDGTIFPLELSVGEVHAPGQRLFTGIVRDISDRKRLEMESHRRLQQLAHVERLSSMGDLAAGLAHEVNQPLTAIISHAQASLRLLERGDMPPEQLAESLRQIARQGERASEVIRRLRKFVHKGEIEFAPGNLNTTVRDVLSLLKHELKAHHIEPWLELNAVLPEVWIDRIQMEQVILNLVRNAVDAMSAQPAERRLLVIRTGWSGDQQNVEVKIRDHGVGLTEAVHKRLFEAFFTTKPHGLGQGLTICRTIVEAHGGRIWAEPHADGATFALSLPVKASAP